MKIALLCRKFEETQPTGFERYAYELYKGLLSIGVDVVPFNQDPRLKIKPYGSNLAPLYYEVLSPTARLLRRKGEAELYHAIADTQGVVFPIAHGKKVVTFHHMVGKTPEGSMGEKLFNRYWYLASRIAVAQADKVICISSQTKKEMIEEWDVEPGKIAVVNHGISDVFMSGARAGSGNRIGFVGTLNRRKNLEAALRVMAILRKEHAVDCTLIIYGEGPEKSRLIALAKELGLQDSVEFKGRISDEGLSTFYRSIEAMVFPSLQEGFGFTVLEAQACGTPVVILEDALIPEEVTRECLKCKDQEAMAEAIRRLLSDKHFWSSVSAASRAYASEFTWSKAAINTRKVYADVLGHD